MARSRFDGVHGVWGQVAHLSTSVGDADVATRVTLLRKLAGEEVVQLGAEDTVSDELALLADLAGHFECEAKTREGAL